MPETKQNLIERIMPLLPEGAEESMIDRMVDISEGKGVDPRTSDNAKAYVSEAIKYLCENIPGLETETVSHIKAVFRDSSRNNYHA